MSTKVFVEDWHFVGVLGEGAFGEVKLLMNIKTHTKLAVKMVDIKEHDDAVKMARKEICIHKSLKHPNVLKFYGSRQEEDVLMMFLEYAIGGELFDKIEPDVGMPVNQAQNYMKQLLTGVQYLHQKGIAHRDIKPENLLINGNNVLKISDFGLATMFRLKGRERLLTKRCGTLPYVAPEVIGGEPYAAEPADIWSCMVVLVCMLCGEAPFNQASKDCPYYKKWISGNYMLVSPWTKLRYTALNLLKKVFVPNPRQRLTIPQILNHQWMNTDFDSEDDGCNEPAAKKFLADEKDSSDGSSVMSYSQPTSYIPSVCIDEVVELLKKRTNWNNYFSQPTQNENLVVNSQVPLTQTQSINLDAFQNMVKRMTRFFVKIDWEKLLQTLGSVMDKLHYIWNADVSGVVTASTVDKRKMPLVFKVNLLEMNGKLLLDFRLSKGCGLEFKRRFLQLKQALREVIDKEVAVPQ